MSCNKANNCQKYKMNIGNPNDWENPCNRCPYNISDYDSGYNKAIDDCKELTFREVVYYDSLNDRTEFRELAERLKAGGENEQNI